MMCLVDIFTEKNHIRFAWKCIVRDSGEHSSFTITNYINSLHELLVWVPLFSLVNNFICLGHYCACLQLIYLIDICSGGRDLSGNKRTNKKQSFDQKFIKYNEALRVSCRKGYPVRVVR